MSKSKIKDTEKLIVTVDVTNIGDMTGHEVVQLYVHDPHSEVPKPVKELKGFQKIYCAPGETKTVSFTLDKRSFAYYNTQISDWYAESGSYEILIGAASDDIRLKGKVEVESTSALHKTYNAYVTMGELMEIPGGPQAMASVTGTFQNQPVISPEEKEARLMDEDLEDNTAMDYAAMGKDMPLIKVADMAGDNFTDEQLQLILDLINGKGNDRTEIT